MAQLRKVILVVLAIFAFLCASDQNSCASRAQEKQKGISYAAWWPGLYSLPESDISLAHLAETGANWISLIVTCYQDTISSTNIYPSDGTPTDEDLVHVLDRAHALGLKVMLKPHLDLWNDPAHWRGQIGPAFGTEAEWQEWFASYLAFIKHYAKLAAAHGADQFCLGTELQGTSHREADWRNIAAGVRSLYAGPLVYAANHSSEETSLAWWDALDFIGVDTYYPLANKNNPTLAELKAAWQPHVSTLAGLVSRWQKPLLVTEIGYRSLDGAASHPWDWQIAGAVDLKEQADCYQAAFESLYNQPWLAGIFWWSWGPDPLEGGPYDTGYTPHDKPAEDVLRSWFGGARRRFIRREPESQPARAMAIFTDRLEPGWEDWSWDAWCQLGATEYARRGNASIRARLAPWGGLSFRHEPFHSGPYYRLEFFIRGASESLPDLWVYFQDEADRVLLRAAINDRRYIQEELVGEESWQFVSIPLFNLGAARKFLSRLSFQDRSGQGTADFWIDELAIMGAKRSPARSRSGKK